MDGGVSPGGGLGRRGVSREGSSISCCSVETGTRGFHVLSYAMLLRGFVSIVFVGPCSGSSVSTVMEVRMRQAALRLFDAVSSTDVLLLWHASWKMADAGFLQP